jgi:hypothetical protein
MAGYVTRPSGGAVASYSPFKLATSPPLVAAFGAPINPGASVITQGTGGDLIIEAAAAVGLSARFYPLVGTYTGTKTLRANLSRIAFDVGSSHGGFGLFLRRSANGRAVALMHRGGEFSWVRWTDPSSVTITWSVTASESEPLWLEIADNGSACTGNYSADGSYWSTSSVIPDSVTAETYAAFLGDKPDQMGIVGFADNAFGIKALAACHHLVVT